MGSKKMKWSMNDESASKRLDSKSFKRKRLLASAGWDFPVGLEVLDSRMTPTCLDTLKVLEC